MQAYSLPDITPDGAPTAITTNANLRAVAVIFAAPASNSAGIRVGDLNVGSGRGVLVNPGGSVVVFPRAAFEQQGYQLNTIYAYGSGSDVVTITYVQ